MAKVGKLQLGGFPIREMDLAEGLDEDTIREEGRELIS